VTVVRKGLLDHSDSLGAAARYGEGDVQWLTAGSGIQHAEMFPLLNARADNPLELFQIWLNLPRSKKLVAPHFSMLWAGSIPNVQHRDLHGRLTDVSLRAGSLGSVHAPPPAPNSWAASNDNEVAIWTIRMAPKAQWTLPLAARGLSRSLYLFRGASILAGDQAVRVGHVLGLNSGMPLLLENGDLEAELLLLQGRPIGEPLARRGPFVMNTELEIRQAYSDFRETQFGGWPWPSSDPVHGAGVERFAKRPDGTVERPG
jgi:redox-sensitive bicupin YhaK (pirin superfamily)